MPERQKRKSMSSKTINEARNNKKAAKRGNVHHSPARLSELNKVLISNGGSMVVMEAMNKRIEAELGRRVRSRRAS